MANNDCYKNKVKIGAKGAEELNLLLRHPMCLVSNLDLTDNSMTIDALHHVISGVRACKSLVSLNLASNDLGHSSQIFSSLLHLFKEETSVLQELNLSGNQLVDKHIEELSNAFKQDRKLNLTSLNLADNKFKPYGLATLMCALSNNSYAPINRLILNNNDFEVSKKTGNAGYF